MTSDIICDATVKYIIDSEQHLDLAFRVEEAMPILRKCLAEKIVRDVEKRFSEDESDKKESDWRVVFTDYGDVMEGERSLIVLRKNGWCEHDNEDRMTGIHLESEADFSRPYINLRFHEAYIEGKEKDIFEKFQLKGRHKSADGGLPRWILWRYVFNKGKDVSKEAANSGKREEIVKQFIRMIDDMAAEIDDTMKNLGCNA